MTRLEGLSSFADRRTVTEWPAPRRASPRVTAMDRSSSASRIFIQDPAKYVPPGVGLRGCAARPSHHIQSGRVFQEFKDLIVQDVQSPGLDGATVLEEKVGVALLLSGDGREDDHGQLLGQALRDGEAAGFRNDEVALPHQF